MDEKRGCELECPVCYRTLFPEGIDLECFMLKTKWMYQCSDCDVTISRPAVSEMPDEYECEECGGKFDPLEITECGGRLLCYPCWNVLFLQKGDQDYNS